jgi:hypothetical protein
LLFDRHFYVAFNYELTLLFSEGVKARSTLAVCLSINIIAILIDHKRVQWAASSSNDIPFSVKPSWNLTQFINSEWECHSPPLPPGEVVSGAPGGERAVRRHPEAGGVRAMDGEVADVRSEVRGPEDHRV